MRFKSMLILFCSLILIISLASEGFAAVSDAALLYLRIAPGARAAGMGEAYVAVADDGTASHWNPAGLGAAPLSGNWDQSSIPGELRPITSLTTQKARGGSDFASFDVWAISKKGLVRFDSKSWHLDEVFGTKTSQTLEKIVSNYVKFTDVEKQQAVVKAVARDNSDVSYDELKAFSEKVIAAIPEDYKDKDAIVTGFDSLMAGYSECLINWAKYKEMTELFNEGMKDSLLEEKESDRINFAVEKAKNRFVPEEVKINFASIISGEITSLASIGNNVYVGTDIGLYHFNGSNWKFYNTENGLPSNNILTLFALGTRLIAGTDAGAARFDNIEFQTIDPDGQLPVGSVTAIGGYNSLDYYVVIDGKLFHNLDREWSDKITYTTVLDDTPEKVAERFAIYDTPTELDYFKNNLYMVQKTPVESNENTDSTETTTDSTTANETTALDTTAAETKTEYTTELVKVEPDFTFEAGTEISVPLSYQIKGKVKVIYVDNAKNLYLGTEYGLIFLKNDRWRMAGYTDFTVPSDMPLDSIVANNKNSRMSDKENRDQLIVINDLDENADVPANRVLKIMKTGAPEEINSINARGASIYVASTSGLYNLSGNSLSVVSEGGLNNRNVQKAIIRDNDMWFASSDRMVTRGSGRTDISVMFAKWLPELSDDIYYVFLGAAHSIEGFGTIGGNITYITYGVVNRTDPNGNPLGTFEPYDLAFTLSYGSSINRTWKYGVSLKFIRSELSKIGAGNEVGEGTATGVALDFGFLGHLTDRFNVGLAVTNLGPDVSYIDASQSDPLPRNGAFGFSWKVMQSDYTHLLLTSEVNKSLVDMGDWSDVIFNGGFEFSYANIISFRSGYVYDDAGDVKTLTLGVGLAPLRNFIFDFAYIPSSTDAPLANTLRISMQILP